MLKVKNMLSKTCNKLSLAAIPVIAAANNVISCTNFWESDETIKQGAIDFIDLIAPTVIVIAIAAAIIFFFWGLFSSKDAPVKFKTAGIALGVAIVFGIGGAFIYGSFSAIFDVFKNAA